MTHITIIGGGIAGLATAFYLQKKSREQNLAVEYTLLESSNRFGGQIITSIEDDFIIEGGPDSFITQKPWATQLCYDLGIADRLIPTNDHMRNIYVLNKGKLTPFPGGMRLTIPTEIMPFLRSSLISPLGKLRMGLDFLIPPGNSNGDESLASFIRRRLGEEALDKFADPIMAGIYSANPENLSIQSTFPQFAAMEKKHGSLIRAMQITKQKRLAAPKPRNGNGNGAKKPPSMFTSLRGGMSELVDALVESLKGDLRTSSRVKALRRLDNGFDVTLKSGDTLRTDAIVLALPAYVAAFLLESIQPQLSDQLRQIRYTSTATISLGYRLADLPTDLDLDGFGFVIPRSEHRQIQACTWTSTKFDHRAPEGMALIRTFVGGDGHEHLVDLPDAELIALATGELADIMGLTATPTTTKIYRWAHGRPQYDVGHLHRVGEIEQTAATVPGLHLTGSAFRGVGIPDCIKSAMSTADQVLMACA